MLVKTKHVKTLDMINMPVKPLLVNCTHNYMSEAIRFKILIADKSKRLDLLELYDDTNET